jgi:hypothetical protein
LKKHGFQEMPSTCEKAPLKELDSCLERVKANPKKAAKEAEGWTDYVPKEGAAEQSLQTTQTAVQRAPAADNGWLTQLPEEYLFACFETDRSRCSSSITHLKYLPEENLLMETGQFQDHFLDTTDKKFKASEGHWYTSCPLHQSKNGHWIGECTYTLFWPEAGKPPSVACKLNTSEEITEITSQGLISGLSGKIDWTPRYDPLNPRCPQDSGKKNEFHLVPKQ